MAGGKIDILIDPDTKGFGSKLESGLKGATGIAGKVGKGIALALAAGTAAAGFGLSAIISKGVEYQSNLNEMQAVTQATAIQMQQIGKVAKDLGADMSLPATSAADAAAAMVELAKGGLSVDASMKAAKGTLQLAAAAQIGAAQAAEIQSNALNSFGLSADKAGHVADVLANTANAASGSIVDIAESLKFLGPVAKGLNIDIDNVSAAIGLLANSGIKGEQAGTSLRGILASLASPSKAAAKALDELGVKAFDQQGKFVGLRVITDELAKAKGRLTDAQFAAAASTAFGNEGFTAANALANSGAKAFDDMAVAVGRSGGAADVAAAKTKGLGGAIEGFKSQVETAGIGIFEKISPTLEKGVRAAADVVAKITPAVVQGLDTAVSAGQVFGPRLADAMKARGAVVVDAARDVVGPIAKTIPGLLNASLNVAIDLWGNFTDILHNAVDAAKPVASGIAAVAKAAIEADGPVSAVGAGLRLVGNVAAGVSSVLVPIGQVIGVVAHAFADLPGPVQSAIIALGLLAAFRGPLSSLGDTVTSRVTAPFKSMGEEVRLQQALLTGSTDIMSTQVGKVGLAMAALESRVPAIGRMAAAYRDVSTSIEGTVRGHAALAATSLAVQGSSETTVGFVEKTGGALGKLSGIAAGTAAALGSGLKSAASGIVGAFGGPWGLAIAGAATGLSLLAGANDRAAQKEAEHRRQVDDLSGALRESKGAIDDNVRSLAVKRLEDSGALQAARDLGIPLDVLTNAYLGNKGALDQVNAVLGVYIKQVEGQGQLEGQVAGQNPLADKADELKRTLAGLSGEFAAAEEKNRRFDEAVRTGNVSMLDATGAGKTLSKAMGVLRDSTASADDRARALKDALDALSGGQVNLEAAQSRLNDQLGRLSEAFGANVDKAKGFGKELINANGSINTVLPNGRQLFQTMQEISGSMAEVAQKTFDASVKSGDDLPAALAKAKKSAEDTRKAFIDQHDQMGLTADQAAALADHYGLLPDKVVTLITAPGMDATQLELLTLRDLVNAVPAGKDITVRSLSDEAKRKLQDLGFTVVTLPDGSVTIHANTEPAKTNLDSFIANNQNRTLTIQARVAINSAALASQLRLGNEFGNIVQPFAAGGLSRGLTPMQGGVATIVPPNTWRVVGDRMVDDEAFIPINRSQRSLALLEETAARMGFTLARRFAVGGVASTQGAQAAAAMAGPMVIENHIEIGGEVVRVVRTEISGANRATRTRILAGAGAEL